MRVLLVALSAALGVILVRQVDDDLPLAVSVDRALRTPVEDVGGADVATALVVVLRIGVTPGISSVQFHVQDPPTKSQTGRGHSTEGAFTLLTLPTQVRFSASRVFLGKIC